MGAYLSQMPMQVGAGDKIDLITTFPAGSGAFNTMALSLIHILPEDLKAVIGEWGRIISDVPLSMGVLLKSAQVAAGGDNKLILGF